MKYIKLFDTLANARTSGAAGLDSPHVDYIREKDTVNIYSSATSPFTCNFDNDGHILIEPTQPNDEIWYTSSDGQVIDKFNAASYFGDNLTLVSNTYTDGKGVAKYSGDVTKIGDLVFEECTSLTNITIPNSVTSIGSDAFSYCNSLTGIAIPSSVTSMGVTPFYKCNLFPKDSYGVQYTSLNTNDNPYLNDAHTQTPLTVYDIIQGTKFIGNCAFMECSLTNITIPNSVTSIETDAFNYCPNLTNITIPNSVTSIETDAFSHCDSLSEVICNPTTPPTLGDRVFDNNASGRKIKVPAESVNTYKTATNWNMYADDIISQ